MPRSTDKLSATAVRAAPFEGRAFKLFDGGGLFLHVQKFGRYWRMKYRFRRYEKLLALGVYPHAGLADARGRRDNARKLLAEGIDPSGQRQATKAEKAASGDTLKAVADEWLEKQRTNLAANTLKLARRRLELWIFPEIGDAMIREIEPPDILMALRKIEAAGRHETAHRVRQHLGQVFRYAIATGKATRDPTADLRGALSVSPTRNRSAITEPREASTLLRAIEAYDGQPATCAALKLLALTFVRPGELRKAEWSEFDLEAATWRIPAARMKMKRDHLVPLSPQAVEILTELHALTGHRPYVFEATRRGRPLSENTINVALRILGYTGDQMTAHGFRAMASTLLHELGWPPEVIELQLAHAQRSQVAAAYNRSARLPERKKMMAAWADYLDTLKAADGNVTPIRAPSRT